MIQHIRTWGEIFQRWSFFLDKFYREKNINRLFKLNDPFIQAIGGWIFCSSLTAPFPFLDRRSLGRKWLLNNHFFLIFLQNSCQHSTRLSTSPITNDNKEIDKKKKKKSKERKWSCAKKSQKPNKKPVLEHFSVHSDIYTNTRYANP